MALNYDYDYASGCTGGPKPGAIALMSWYLGAYAGERNPAVANLGIYACKRLGSGWSIHAEGRACDLGTRPYAKPGPWMWTLLNALRLNSKELGVQLIIHEGRIWSSSYPTAGWRKYTGDDPHNGHAHVELTDEAARTLTAAKLESVLHRGVTVPTPPTVPSKPNMPATDWTEELIMALPTLKRGAKGTDVGRVQGLLHANGYRSSAIDRDFGPKTEADVKRFQARNNVPNSVRNGTGDGIVGRHTWTKLLGE